jgi:hypothetical protein
MIFGAVRWTFLFFELVRETRIGLILVLVFLDIVGGRIENNDFSMVV